MPRHANRILLLLQMFGLCMAGARGLQAQERPWSVGLEISYNDFAGGATDFQGSRVLPSDRFGMTVLGARQLDQWVLRIEAGVSNGHLAGSDSGSTFELIQLDSKMPRYRIEPLVGRSIVPIGAGGLLIYLGATMDWWRLDGETRFTVGGEARLALQAPLGRLVLENYLGFGIAPQPYPSVELTPGLTTHPTETLALGFSLRYRF